MNNSDLEKTNLAIVKIKEKKIDEIKEKISIKTRQYAKRQSTWARGNMSDWVKLKPSEINNFLKKI
mgnify:CR=1 FL=1